MSEATGQESPITNLVEVFERSCARYAERPVSGTKEDGEWVWSTYGELKTLVDRCRGGLASLGVAPGDKVAIISNNRPEWAVVAFAVFGRKAAIVPMYEAQRPQEWRFILEDSGAKVVFTGSDRIDRELRSFQKELPTLEHVVGFDLPEDDERSYRALLAKGSSAPVEAEEPSSETTACLIYTSGTTGNPKGVILSHGNVTSTFRVLDELFDAVPDDRSLSFLPWAHAYGQVNELYAGIHVGGSTAINDDVANLVTNLAEVKPTVLLAVPRVFNAIYTGVNQQMAQKPAWVQKLFRAGLATATAIGGGQPVSVRDRMRLWLASKLIFRKIRAKFGGRLRFVYSGSAALSQRVAEFIDALGITVYEGYGLTETSPSVSTNSPGIRRFGSVGKPVPGVTVKIDETVGEGTRGGEIIVYGPNVMQGYHNRPEETAEVMTPDGGLRTGDLGYFDEDGFLFIAGRIKEQYKLETGKYVMPAPLEEQLKLSPYIANVFVYGVNKPYNVVLVVPDRAAVEAWARGQGIDLGDLEQDDRVAELIEAEVANYGADFRSFDKPKKVLITAEDFTTDNGLLTPTLKIKRQRMVEKYGEALDALYEPLLDAPALEGTRADEDERGDQPSR